ncbi:protein DOUBLE-STRAND BREAK FORMATION isoform X1 [Benincasa hispida]|uniref:protein DOUBLE-STRAND BREAK FORMATION isoform X1 n=1 Tax=Benincasa hispida TaxID=102211 RepID=UPI0018FF44EA|nr:protein DOUBLE-STRAND BREAK FORMATION isoform X1 [Benincasa hispida]
MSCSAAEQYSLFRSRLRSRRFDDSTLRILEFFPASKDAMSLMDVKSDLKEFLRFESLSIIRETAEKTDDQKLLVIEFLVRAFALVGDIESCLALRYEALNFRLLKSFNQPWLQVSHAEWLNFAEHSLRAGFFSIAIKAYEQALSSLQQNDTENYTSHGSLKRIEVIEKIKRLKDHALRSAGSHSVQALTSEYLNKKVTERNIKISSSCTRKSTASTLFRNGFRNHNAKKLHEYQVLEGLTSESHKIQFRDRTYM